MTPFLQQIATVFYREYGTRIARLAFVFPNRRAGLFFRKYLSELSEKPLFSPTILTINDLVQQLSDKQEADRLHLLFLLYKLYIEQCGADESFDDFLFWGEMLLNDFNDVDKYMVDARMLFTNITDLHSIEQDYTFLSPEQIAAIRSFWSTFYPTGDSKNQKEFLAVWDILYDLYLRFKQRLSDEGKGYEGMLYRETVQRLKEHTDINIPYDKVVFVGFNALSTAEEQLLLLLRDRGIADFYWDYTSAFVMDPQNRASHFSTRNLKLFPSSFSLPKEETIADKQITVTGISSGTGQAKHVHELLKGLLQNEQINAEDSLRTAIILPDEHLLIPLLHSIPEEVGHVNVTMGYSLSNTPIAALMDYVLALQKNIRMVEGKQTFYFRDVLPILNHPYVVSESPEKIAKLVKEIIGKNQIYVNEDFLHVTPLLNTVFKMVQSVDDCMSYLVSILERFNKIIAAENRTEEETEMESPATSQDIQQEFIYYYYTTINRIKELIQEAGIEMKIDTCFRLIKRATDLITIPFDGEPLSGLQIMGVLETRTLDFDRVIILSVNEGVFPTGRSSSSFIPYNLRRGFGLPTYEHQDSVWAYHFYRLIHRAKEVNLLYDTRSGGLLSGEMSRYIYQLQYHYELPIQNKLVVYNVASSKINTYAVEKTDEIMQKLSVYVAGGGKALSASALNVYLDCPLMFYFSAIEGVKEVDEVSESIENNVFGSILHKVMEDLYRPLQGQLLTADIFKILQKDNKGMTEIIRNAFAEEFYKDIKGPLVGQNYLVSEMIRKYALKIIEQDAKLTPFRYLESEREVFADFTLTNGKHIQLKGFIDRMDEVDNTLRIIDYKSGGGTAEFQTIPGLFDKENKKRPKAVMQVFLYAWMVMQQEDFRQIDQLYPGIYYLRSLFLADFSAYIKQKNGRNNSVLVDDFSRYAEEFESHLRTDCLDELFNPEVPFFQTPTGNACSYCQFKSICGK